MKVIWSLLHYNRPCAARLICFHLFIKMGSYYVALAALKLKVLARPSPHGALPASAGIKGGHHHSQLLLQGLNEITVLEARVVVSCTQ